MECSHSLGGTPQSCCASVLTCPLLPASGSRARTTATRLPTALSSATLTEESEVMSNWGLLSFSSRTVMVTCGHSVGLRRGQGQEPVPLPTRHQQAR